MSAWYKSQLRTSKLYFMEGEEDYSTMSQQSPNPGQRHRSHLRGLDTMEQLMAELPLDQNSSNVCLEQHQITGTSQTQTRHDDSQTSTTEVPAVSSQLLNPFHPLGNQFGIRDLGGIAELGEALTCDRAMNVCPAPQRTEAAHVQTPEEKGQNPVNMLVTNLAVMFMLHGAANFVSSATVVEPEKVNDPETECRGFYGDVGGLDCDEPERKKEGKHNRKNKSRRKKKQKALAEQQCEYGNVLGITDQGDKESATCRYNTRDNPIVEKWDELMSDDWKKLMPCCAQCQAELTSGQGLRCSRCQVARYCGNHCKNKDSKKHKPTCMRIFEFNAANAKWKEEARKVKELANSVQLPEVPELVSGLRPASFFIGSIPNPERFKFIGMPLPVLLKITGAGLATDNRSWKLTVQDVTNMSAYVSIDTNEISVPFQNHYIAQNLRVGNFIVIKNACGVSVGKDIFHIQLEKLFLQFIIVAGVNLLRNGDIFSE